MRSYSTLFTHILASNNEICGYTEMKLSYKNSFDLQKSKYKALHLYKDQIERKYILDKILHNKCSVSETILLNENIKIIFLLRKPMETVESIIEMSKKKSDEDWASRYYSTRLAKLSEYSAIAAGKFLFIKSEDLINNTEKTLTRVSGFLDLKEELKPEYDIFKYTGVKGLGDPSEYIKAGKILNERNAKNVHISDEVRSKCEIDYSECLKILSENQLAI